MFVRVWEYEVPGDRAAAFTAAYVPDGSWGQLFGRAAGFLGTELYRDAARDDRYLTIDRWQDEQDPDQPVRRQCHSLGRRHASPTMAPTAATTLMMAP